MRILIILICLISFINPGCKNSGDQQAGQKQKTIRIPADFPDISTALIKALPGDIIMLSPGTYTENGIIISPLNGRRTMKNH